MVDNSRFRINSHGTPTASQEGNSPEFHVTALHNSGRTTPNTRRLTSNSSIRAVLTGKYLSLEEARRTGQLDRFCNEHLPSKAVEVCFPPNSAIQMAKRQ